MKVALTYDDIQLVPAYSEIGSRRDIRLCTHVTRHYGIVQPLVASPMDTVCDSEMAIAMMELGGLGIIHRFMTIEQQRNEVARVLSARTIELYKKLGVTNTNWHGNLLQIPIAAAVGANGDFYERAKALVEAGADIILIDVAHGHHKNVRDAIKRIKSIDPYIDVIAGNIATAKAAEDLIAWGADGLRVGVGGGSLCTTRVKTGFGVPNVSCLEAVCEIAEVPVMADGGIRSSGDIAKALAIGASTVMIGSLIAGTEEAPGSIIEKPNGLYKRYRGAASLETKMVHGQEARNIEGESTVIPYKGGVKYIVEGLLDGVRSALSYAGASSLDYYAPNYVQVTNAGQNEARPHLL
ncbi:GuaB IMP dehydrogenase/GMP reductase [uncultured Caudovirales phage]|uniref:GuaB IMP dehydrogenase/GMP reductase n=1 Tax=uncultured Caudovirales phage TaxID=2100421 RepID=A0A6J5M758_9CAUD|nr:GuaB IMP dehydrogenase/GMP reductase [uncultured Caudovirales phage]